MRRVTIIIALLSLVLLISGCSPRDMRIPVANDKPRVSSTDYLYDIAKRNIDGMVPFYIYGYNPNVGVTDEVVWEYSTGFTFPSVPMRMELISTSGQDGVGGTGALTVKLYYLDTLYNLRTETVTMNGLVAAPTIATNIYRVNNMVVQSAGSNNAPVGNIALQGFGGGSIYMYLLAGRNLSKCMVYTVPAGHTLYLTSLIYSSSDAQKGVKVALKANYDPYDGGLALNNFVSFSECVLYNNALFIPLDCPLRFPSRTDLKNVCVSGQAGAELVGNMRGWLEVED